MEKVRTALRPSLLLISVSLNWTNRGEIFRMCESENMAIHVIEMTKLEVSGNLVALVLKC